MSCLRAIKSLQRSLKSFGGNDFVDIFCEFAYHLYTTFPLPHSKTCPNVVCLCPANLQPVIRLQCCFTNCYLEATSSFFLSVSVCLSVCLSLCVCVCVRCFDFITEVKQHLLCGSVSSCCVAMTTLHTIKGQTRPGNPGAVFLS